MHKIEEQVRLYGTKSLSNEQLFTYVLGRKYVMQLNIKWPMLEQLRSAKSSEKSDIKLKCLLEITHRLNAHGDKTIRGLSDIENLYHEMKFYKKELLKGIYVNNRLEILGEEILAIGSLNSHISHPREILEPAIRLGASGFFLLHNHPSGDPTPSDEDLKSTQKIKQAAQIMQITLLDHIILARKGLFSFSEKKLL